MKQSFAMRYKQALQASKQRLAAGSQLHETACGLVEAASTGKGSSVLISHGGGGGYDMGLWLADLIGGAFHFIAPSRFGYLRTPLPAEPTPQSQADIYAALLDQLNIQSTLIIGLSAGGPSALQFALRYPERCRGIMMLSAVSISLPPLPAVLRAIYPLILRSDFIPWAIFALAPDLVYQGNGVNRTLLAQIKGDAEKMDYLHNLYQTTFPVSLRREGIINDMQQVISLQAQPYPIERIAAPALVIHAIDDPIVPFENGEHTAHKISNAQFISLKGGGHFCSVTHREKIIPLMQEFLKDK